MPCRGQGVFRASGWRRSPAPAAAARASPTAPAAKRAAGASAATHQPGRPSGPRAPRRWRGQPSRPDQLRARAAGPSGKHQNRWGRLASDAGSGHGVEHGGVQERLIALGIDDDGALRFAIHRGQQLGSHRGNALTSGSAIGAGQECLNPQAGSLVGQLLAIAAERDGACRFGLQTAFQPMLEHRLAIDFCDQLAR